MSRLGAKVVEWNGHDVPAELAALPPGRYLLEPLAPPEAWGLEPEQVAELEAAIEAHERGEGRSWEDINGRLRQLLASRGLGTAGP